MADKTTFELVAPERILMAQPVDMVVMPGGDGDFGALRGHAPLISTLRPGRIDVYETRPTVSARIFVSGGFAEISQDRITVLAEGAVALEDLDAAEIDQRIADLSEDVADAKDEAEKAAATAALDIARAQKRALV